MPQYLVAMQKKPYRIDDAPYYLADDADVFEWTTDLESAAVYSKREEAQKDASKVGGVVVRADTNPSEQAGI